MKLSFLIITESINLNDSSGSKGNVAIIKNLVTLGYLVKVLHYTRQDLSIEGANCIAIKEHKFNLNYLASRLQRLLKRHFNIELHRWLETRFGFSFTYFNDVKSISKAIIKHYDNEDVVLTLSKGASYKPHYAMLNHPGLHHRWMAYIHDPYPFSCYPKPYDWLEPGYPKKETFFTKVAQSCKWAAYPSKLLQEWMEDHFKHFKGKGKVIPHQQITMDTSEVALPEYFDTTKFNLLHAGNLMKQRDPSYLIDAFKLFLKNNPRAKDDARLILIGACSYHKTYLLKEQSDLPQLYVSKGSVDFKIVYKIQQMATVNVILEAKADISPFLPGKFPHCVAANRPILHLGPRNSETRRLLGSKYSYQVEVNNIEGVASNISKLYYIWKKEPLKMTLDRPDLNHYLSNENFEEVMARLISK